MSALIAYEVARFLNCCNSLAVLAVPFPSFGRAVPRLSERANLLHVLAGGLGALRRPMFTCVGLGVEANEVVQGVVERIAVAVVDVVAARYGAVSGLPDFPVKALDAVRAIRDPRREIEAKLSMRRVGIAPELDFSKLHDDDPRHVRSVSP